MNFKYLLYLLVTAVFSVAAAAPEVELFRAVNVDDDRTVRSLLSKGLDPNLVNAQGQSALFLSMKDESVKVAEALLSHPAIKVDAPNTADETALMMAAMRGRLDWVKKLADRGAALSRAGWSPLHYACSGPDGLAVAAFLLDKGAPIDARSPNGTTPLMMAARYGSYDVAELLIARGANTKLRNDRDLLAADFARMGGREPLADRLSKLAIP